MNTAKRYFFRKENKLKSRKIIQQIFAEGNSFTVFPLKVMWLPSNEKNTLQAGISVSSRYFKRAVDRNRIKRLIREAYRLQKIELEEHLSQNHQQLSIFLIFIAKEIPDYQTIFNASGRVIHKLIKVANENHQ